MAMCWAHMRRNYVKNIEALVSKEHQHNIIEDIDQSELSQVQRFLREHLHFSLRNGSRKMKMNIWHT